LFFKKRGIAELYYKRWSVETKYKQAKQKLELENFSGRLVENIKQNFYAMMTISNMLASRRSKIKLRVKTFQFYPGIGSRKSPGDLTAFSIPYFVPHPHSLPLLFLCPTRAGNL
jgi:hypothetical protein